MLRRNFLRAMAALPVVGGMAACGKGGDPAVTEPGTKLEPAWLVWRDAYDERHKAFLGMFPETESGYARAQMVAYGPPTWTYGTVPYWVTESHELELERGKVLRGLDLPLEDLVQIFYP